MITWKDFSGWGYSRWHPSCQNLAPLLAQSKHCTCLFISPSSLSLLTVGKYTQTLQINYKLSGPVPLLIIMCKSQKKKKKKKSWFVEQKHVNISAMNINVLWHEALCALSSPSSVVVLEFSSRLLIEASLCIPVVTSLTLLMFEKERRRSCLTITRCSAWDSWLIRVHQSCEETKRTACTKNLRVAVCMFLPTWLLLSSPCGPSALRLASIYRLKITFKKTLSACFVISCQQMQNIHNLNEMGNRQGARLIFTQRLN